MSERLPRDASFDEVLDACIDDLAAGRRTLEQCLEAWPQHREALAAVLGTAEALQHMPRGAERAPDPARRAAFMSQIRELPQEQPAASSSHGPASPAPGARATGGGLSGALRAARRLVPTLSPGRAGLLAAPAAAAAVVLALVLVVGSSPSTAHAATATVFGGEVERAVDDGWEPLADGASVAEGDRVRTGDDGRVVLTFEDGSTVALDPATELRVARLALDGERAIELVQERGRLWNDVATAVGGSYVVETPDARVSAQGTLFEVVVGHGQTDVTAEDGVVEVVAGESRALVAAGETTTARDHAAVEAVRRLLRADDRALELTVDGPFAASLIDPHERATGALPDGLLYRQIAGAVTTNPGDGDQRIAVFHPEDGTYELVLRRVEGGTGVLLIRVGERVERIPLDAVDEGVRLRIAVATRDGRIEATPELVERATQATLQALVERIVVTDEARDRAVPVAEQLAARRAAASDAVPSGTPSVTPTRAVATSTDGAATPGDAATVTATVQTDERPTATPTTSTVDVTLAQAVERCAAQVMAGNATLRECVARWPAYADRLDPAVRDWFTRGMDVPRDSATFEQALRACVGGMLTRSFVLEECGKRWPVFAERLLPAARATLDGLGAPVPAATDDAATPSTNVTPTATATRSDAVTPSDSASGDSATP